MTNYTKTTDFASKDTLPSGNANKIVKGTEIDTEFNNIATTVATKADSASPTFTGVISVPDGSASAPSITNTGDTNAGLFFSAADTLAFTAGGTAQFTMADGVIAPVTDNDIDLGTSSLKFKDFYIDGIAYLDAINLNGTAITSTATEINILDGVTSTAAELNILDGVTSTTAELNILDGVTSTAAEINLLDGVTATTTELNYNDTGASVGTVVASKVVTVDANKDVASFRNITLTGELDAGSLDISGDADIDGTLETDALSINGTAVTSTAAELNILDGATVVVGEINALDLGSTAVGTAIASKAVILDSSKDYTGIRNLTITGELDAATLDISGDVDVDGTLETDALSINGTAVTSTAVELNILDGVTSTAAELNILDGKAFLDEDNMASNSATGIASQQSIKAYVDSQVTAQDLDFQADSGGALSIDLDSETLTFTGGTGIDTSGSGNAVTFAIDSTVTTLTGSQTLTNKTLTAPTLTGTAVVASLDISGDIDVDGTSNLDILDVDGAANFAADVTLADGADLITASAGSSNLRLGVNAGNSIESGGNYNVVVGDEAGTALTTGDNNVAVGYAALDAEDTGTNSVAIGYNALTTQNNDAANYNVAVGSSAGSAITSGIQNVLVGGLAGNSLTDADFNVAIGTSALTADTLGSKSVAIGHGALNVQNFTTATDSFNTAVGYLAGAAVTTGVQNTVIGGNAGDAISTGVQNTLIGYNNDVDTGSADNRIGLGVNLNLTSNSTIKIGNGATFITNTWGSNATWSHSSDERLKEQVEDATLGLSFINDLRPVTFYWRSQADVPEEIRSDFERQTEIKQHGLIAQEVKTALDAAGVDTFLGWSEEKDGTQMISESMFVFPLIKAIQEQQALINSLTARVAALES